MSPEITIILKDESRTIRQKHLIYETFACHPEDPVIRMCIEDTKKNFDGNPTDVIVKISLTVQ